MRKSNDPPVWKTTHIWLLAVVLPFLFLCWVRTEAVKPRTELEPDSFYHVMMADLFPEACVAKTFPHLTLSIWKEHFYDKELAFHMILSVIRRYAQMTGLNLSPPFHLPALLFGLLTVSAFFIVACLLRIPRVYLFVWLFVAISPFFTYRLLMLRPHHLALIFMLTYCLFLCRMNDAKGAWKSVFFGFAAAYAYSQPHFLLLPALVYACLRWKERPQLLYMLPLSLIAGIIAGFTLHPQFPNTFIGWKVQSIDVIMQSLFERAHVYTGVELLPPDAQVLLENFGVYLLVALNAAGFHRLWKECGRRKLPVETVFFFVLQAVTVAGTFISRRAMEYACPFSILATGLVIRDWMDAGFFQEWAKKRLKLARDGLTVAAAILLLISGTIGIRNLRQWEFPELHGFSEWAGRSLPDGTVIANLIWGDFGMLFYSAPQFKYLMGLDPMFGYAYAPECVEKLEKFRTGQVSLTPLEVSELTESRFAFVPLRASPLAKLLIQQGFAVVYRGNDGWLFDLRPEPVGPAHN